MRFPCVLIFLAVAARPVSVGAHAEPSDVVTTDGQFQVQRHSRVQERAHGEDEEERMNGLKFGAEELTSNLQDTKSTLNELAKRAKTLGAKTIADIIFADKAGTIYPNDINNRVNKFVTDAKALYFLNLEMMDLENEFNTLISRFERNELPMVFEKANKHFVRMTIDPWDLFQIYGLHFAKDKLFEQPQLVYWVVYMDTFNAVRPMENKPLLLRLLEFYPIETLVKAVAKVPSDKVALRVRDEIGDYWFEHHFTPNDIFTSWLGLDKDKDNVFDSHWFPFWTGYVTYYNDRAHETSKVSIISILEKHFVSLAPLKKVKSADYTLYLEEEIEGRLLAVWSKKKIPLAMVNKYKRGTIEAVGENSVFMSALQKAADVYIPPHQ